jgi:hypothetical protein
MVLQERFRTDLELQEALTMFQESGMNDDFSLICSLYDPMRYKRRWYASYGNLFDSEADFDGQMWECFAKACVNYKRGYTLNPFYFGILKTTFANIIKHRQAGMRNPQVRCPICDKLVAPLGTHVIQHHPEIMKMALRDMGINMDTITTCPLCDDKPPIVLDDEEAKLKHFRSRHSSILFAKFLSMYPNHHTAITDPAPPIGSLLRPNVDDDSSFGIDDMDIRPIFNIFGSEHGDHKNAFVNMLGDDCLSECQRVVLETIIYDGAENPPSPDRLCKICKETRGECPREDGFRLNRQTYEEELEFLKDIIGDHLPSMV